ncbi:unnamed protein product [Didymodactylos carnosus]|uniref:Uncharacterized protein n=1 Tax=Didymodactylos carnosus TaxID=1234261 RepID=A0A814BEI4_9BILA|nr:unnamed protein product [Didymodactylos carnosus]CAF1094605.1 unnamed protein product [Didymodactylos carnosus]CAF3704470.1 unnamed protein product [Didymodactylos carnosus]CAF3856086.1 unnamed protein product [Didymodactylos carnosus]
MHHSTTSTSSSSVKRQCTSTTTPSLNGLPKRVRNDDSPRSSDITTSPCFSSRDENSNKSSLSVDSPKSSYALDLLLNADRRLNKKGLNESSFSIQENASHNDSSSSSSTLSNTLPAFTSHDLLNYVDQKVLDTKVKRVTSVNDLLQANIKRMKVEHINTVQKLESENEQTLRYEIKQLHSKFNEMESSLNDKDKQLNSNLLDNSNSASLDQRIIVLQNEKLDLNSKFEQMRSSNLVATVRMEQVISKLKQELVDNQNQIKVLQSENERVSSLWKSDHERLIQNENLILILQKLVALEHNKSKNSTSELLKPSMVDDINRMRGVKYENDQLQKEIELLKLKCIEKASRDEEIRRLRKQVDVNNDYHHQLAIKELEIERLRKELALK